MAGGQAEPSGKWLKSIGRVDAFHWMEPWFALAARTAATGAACRDVRGVPSGTRAVNPRHCAAPDSNVRCWPLTAVSFRSRQYGRYRRCFGPKFSGAADRRAGRPGVPRHSGGTHRAWRGKNLRRPSLGLTNERRGARASRLSRRQHSDGGERPAASSKSLKRVGDSAVYFTVCWLF
jgi:hypothetical protein